MRRLLNDGWSFAKLAVESTYQDTLSADFSPVDLPHDWLIWQAEDLYESADAWYKRTIFAQRDGLRRILYFDGVYMDADVLVNGRVIATHHYGYTAFCVDLTDALQEGENEIALHIRHMSPNSRWYSGSGIFRDVVLDTVPECHFVQDGLYVHTEVQGADFLLQVSCEIAGEGEKIAAKLTDPEGNCVLCRTAMIRQGGISFEERIFSPKRWDVENPALYRLTLTLPGDEICAKIGFKTVSVSPDTGLALNGRPLKLHGVCLHHDLGALGAAFHKKAARRQLRVMQEMGVNALRTAHNPPAKDVLDLCDEMGILVMDESFDMWEKPKTPYDYARFFPDDYRQDVASWVRRDRNHPCLLMWSIGNEIYDMHASDRGAVITKALSDEVKKHDPLGNGLITFGSNYMPWAGAQKCAEIIKIPGYNYAEKYYEEHHKLHPDWVIYGSETASVLASRGIYHFPKGEEILSDDDLQCSALGNSNTSWGARSLEKMLADDLNTPFSLGQFVWSGIDYIGEPTPYHTRSCYMGQCDTACFPKDAYYLFKAAWTGQPFVHIGVYWDFNEGQMIDVPVCTTGDEAELFLNGKSLGKKPVNRLSEADICPVWHVPYTPGELEAVAYQKGQIAARQSRHSFSDSKKIVLKCGDTALYATGRDICFVEISVLDGENHPVENARDRVSVSVEGCGYLLGLDNGDADDFDGYKTDCRRLFSGKLLAIIGATDKAGDMKIHVSGRGLEGAELSIPVLEAEKIEGASCMQRITPHGDLGKTDARKLELVAQERLCLSPEHPRAFVGLKVHPQNADCGEITWKICTPGGIPLDCASIEETSGGVWLTARGDGDVHLRASCTNSDGHVRLMSQLEVRITGMGKARLNPYEFVPAGLYDLSDGQLGPGNDHGVAFARDGQSMAGFTNVDFGAVGSDEITLPIFSLSSDVCHHLKLYDGDPREGGVLIDTLDYQKPSIWNVYQAETYHLPRRLTGIRTLCFVMNDKIHLQGFSFKKLCRSGLLLGALEADLLYGDQFTKDVAQNAVLGIGNNVSLVFKDMEFAGERANLLLDGQSNTPVNTVSVRVADSQGHEQTTLCEFEGPGRKTKPFEVRVFPGKCTVTFLFLPGSDFDFYSLRFTEK